MGLWMRCTQGPVQRAEAISEENLLFLEVGHATGVAQLRLLAADATGGQRST
jgi:hypothetical protein